MCPRTQKVGEVLVYGSGRLGDLLTVMVLYPCRQHRQDVLTGRPLDGRPYTISLQALRQGSNCGQVEFLWQKLLEALCRAGFHFLGFYVTTLLSILHSTLVSLSAASSLLGSC